MTTTNATVNANDDGEHDVLDAHDHEVLVTLRSDTGRAKRPAS
jgi:hypothetical protein